MERAFCWLEGSRLRFALVLCMHTMFVTVLLIAAVRF